MSGESIRFLAVLLLCLQYVFSGTPDVNIPSVRVTAPQHCRVINQGTVYIIGWDATDNMSIIARSIYVSFNSRETWDLVDSAPGNSGTYSWTIPPVESKNSVIKIFVYDAAGNMSSGESTREFTIAPDTRIAKTDSALSDKQMFYSKDQCSFLLHLALPTDQSVTISDITGNELISFITTDNNQWFQIPLALSRGMHIVTVRSSEKTFYKMAYFAM